MPAIRNLRRVASETFKPNDEHLINLPETQDYRFVMIELTGSLTVASATATSVPADSPCDLIDRVDLVANGKDVLCQVPFVFAVMGNYEVDYSTEKTAPGTSQATHTIRAVGILDLFNADGLRPKDSAFKAWNTQLFQLRLVTRDADSIIVKGSATLTLSASINVLVDSLIDSDRGEAKFFKKSTYQTAQFAAANSEYAFDLPVGNVMRYIGIRATDDGAPDDALVKAVIFRIDDTDVRCNLTWKQLRSVNQYDRRGAAPNAGFAFVDSSQEGKLTNGFDLRNASRAQLVLDVDTPGGTGKVEVVPVEFLV